MNKTKDIESTQGTGLSVVTHTRAFRPHIRRTEHITHPEIRKSRTKHTPDENPSTVLHKIKQALSRQDSGRQKLPGSMRRLLEEYAAFVSDDGTYTLDPERVARELNLPRGRVNRFLWNGIQYEPAVTRGRVLLDHPRPAQNKKEDYGSGLLRGRLPSKSRRRWRLLK